MVAKIRNLTPHEIVLLKKDESGEITGFTGFGPKQVEARYSEIKKFSSEGVVRASQRDRPAGLLQLDQENIVELILTEFGEVSGLPEPQPDTFYVVSVVAANAAKSQGRSTSDLLLVADTVRNAGGQIIGCQKFARV